MTKLDDQPAILNMADALGLNWRNRPVNAILAYCHERVARWVKEAGHVGTLDQLERLVCCRLRLVIEEFHSDEELEEIVQGHIDRGELAVAALRTSFDEDTFATLIERRGATARSKDRYVAIIDCRGEKAARRFFTRWHEIAHLLTLVRQLELPFHRSTTQRDPVEQLMDVIAGEVGFYDPIVRPAVEAELEGEQRLTFAVIERVRARVCPTASFHAMLIACMKRTSTPVINIEVGAGLKKSEAAILQSRQMNMFTDDQPSPKLRAIVAANNDAARERGFRIHKNMQIPTGSVIFKHYEATQEHKLTIDADGIENLSIWTHSDGSGLGDRDVFVEARRYKDRVIALITPT